MNPTRRTALRFASLSVSLLAAGLLAPLRALAAWNREAFQSKTVADALKGLGIASSADGKDILIDAPQIAENGQVVPVEITSNLANTKSIAVMVDKNPFPLAARFEFADGALPYVKVNVKMSESSLVRVVAEAGGRFYTASREIKVTIGGCGG